jgi:hypothetical protein
MPVKILSLDQLKQEARDGAEFFILLNYNLKSSKWIAWDREERAFLIRNHIDDTKQELTEQQIMDRGYTNIGYAMTKGALFLDVER